MMKKIALVILLAGMGTHAYAQSVPTKAQVNAEILNTINANGRNGITGPILQSDLVQMLAVSASWQGTWGSSVFYSYGEIVSYSGSLWFANTPTLGTPPGSVAGQWTQFSGAAGVITPGTTLIVGGTPGDIEYNNNGVLGEKGTTGSGSVVLSTSPSLTTPDLGTPSAANLANATNLPIATGVSGLGANVAAALAIDIGSTGSVVTNGGALGKPSSGDASNLTGLPISTGVSGLGTGVASALGNPLNGSGGVLGTSLASADLFIGNGSGIAAGVPMSGDATISNSGVLALATSGVTAGTYGDGTHSTQVTFDAKGRATSASSVTITHASGDLAAANNLSDVQSATTARANLGLGTASIQNTGTSGATVPLLNGANTWSAAQTFPNSSITNAELANDAITVNGQSCVLGLTCSVTTESPYALTIGPHLSGGSYDGSSAVTIATDATAAASNNTIMSRDGSASTAVNVLTANGINLPTTTSSTVGVININSVPVVYAFPSSADFFFGHAGNFTGTGTQNVGIGQYALDLYTTGSYNDAFGNTAMENLTTGEFNSALGWASLSSLTTGYSNVAIGSGALVAEVSGSNNTSVGGNSASLYKGSNISSFGSGSLQNDVNGVGDSAFGYDALQLSNAGSLSYNSAFGSQALANNTSGVQNSAFGYNAMQFNTTGSYSNAFGEAALYAETTGNENSAFGQSSMSSTTSGSFNQGFGNNALVQNTTGIYNSAFGAAALNFNINGNYNSALGNQALYTLGKPVTAGAFVTGNSYMIASIGTTDFTAIGASANTVGISFTATGIGSGTGTATPNNTSNNIGIGYNSGYGIYSGINNTIIGSNTTNLPENLSDAIILATGEGSVREDFNYKHPGYWTDSAPRIRAGYTVSTLPSGVIGADAYVTDATACTFLGALTGGGSTFCPVIYNGSAWVGG